MAQRMAKVLSLHPWIVATVADEIVGYAYAGPHRDRAAYRWSVDVTAYLDGRFHRRGIAKRLYAALCTLLKMQHIANAFGLITLPNAASAALHESCGFVRCATETRVGYKFDAWHDVGMWQKALQTGDCRAGRTHCIRLPARRRGRSRARRLSPGSAERPGIGRRVARPTPLSSRHSFL